MTIVTDILGFRLQDGLDIMREFAPADARTEAIDEIDGD